MDVQSVAAAGAQSPVAPAQDATTPVTTGVSPVAPLQSQPVSAQPPTATPEHDSVSALKEPLQKLYAPDAQQFEVSFRVEHDPNMIVTVFRDAATGQEIAQFPPEVMVQLAQFFQKLAGGVLDRSA